MKVLNITEEDFESLMEFSKELQTQDNIGQAFPYFWEAASEKLVTNHNDEGEVRQLLDCNEGETFSPEEYAEENTEAWLKFLEYSDVSENSYDPDFEQDWVDWVIGYCDDIASLSSDWKQSSDHNPSLFHSDVKNYIKCNKHHLGKAPRTYARSVFRMPKMEKLIEIIYRMNPQPKKDVNHEAMRFVFKE